VGNSCIRMTLFPQSAKHSRIALEWKFAHCGISRLPLLEEIMTRTSRNQKGRLNHGRRSCAPSSVIKLAILCPKKDQFQI